MLPNQAAERRLPKSSGRQPKSQEAIFMGGGSDHKTQMVQHQIGTREKHTAV